MRNRPGHLIVAYHGCDAALREALIAGTTRLRPSKNLYDWLGFGAYFFEDDWQRALAFAERAHAEPEHHFTAASIDNPAVVGVTLCISTWLDMSTTEAKREYLDALADLRAQGVALARNSKARPEDTDVIIRGRDKQVIQHIHRRRVATGKHPYEAVRSYFPQGAPLSPDSGFRGDTHVQLALLDDSCVVGYFRVREAELTNEQDVA